MQANTRKAILDALKELDHRQTEKVLTFINSLRPLSTSKRSTHDRFKGEAIRQIQMALRSNYADLKI